MKKVALLSFALGIGLSVAVPQAAAAQGPVSCNYCDEPNRPGGTFYCVLTVRENVCPEDFAPNPVGCSICGGVEEEQQQEVKLELAPDGTLLAPGTVLDGVSADWLGLVAFAGGTDVLMLPASCGTQIHLKAEEDVLLRAGLDLSDR